jgi:arsenate reductase
MKKILVIGTGNDCRSLMMEGWLRYYSGNEAIIYSAGYSPAEVNQMAVKVMMDAMIDITGSEPNSIKDLPEKEFDYVINMAEEKGRNLICDLPGNPTVIEKTSQDCRTLEGTEEVILQKLAAIRDSLEDFCFDFVNEHIQNLMPGDMPDLLKSND